MLTTYPFRQSSHRISYRHVMDGASVATIARCERCGHYVWTDESEEEITSTHYRIEDGALVPDGIFCGGAAGRCYPAHSFNLGGLL